MVAVPRPLKFAIWVAGVLVIVLVAGFLDRRVDGAPVLPADLRDHHVAGLEQPVTVMRDGSGIPQIYADTASDLFFAQGYVQAQDRFFEMDFRRHLTSRDAERDVRADRARDGRVRAHPGLATGRRAAELPLLAPETRSYLQSFSDGVNAYLAERTRCASCRSSTPPCGSSGLDYTPAPWTPVDSLAWLKAMAWNLGSQHPGRDRPVPGVDAADPGRDRRALPAVPLCRASADREPGRRRGRRLRAGRQARRQPRASATGLPGKGLRAGAGLGRTSRLGA